MGHISEELQLKRSAAVVRTRPVPRSLGTITVRARTRRGVMRKLRRGHLRGFYGGASDFAQFSRAAGGGWGVKVHVIRPLPEPMPGWAKGSVVVGLVLTGLSGVAILVLRAMADMFGMMSRVPWPMVIGTLVVAGIVLLCTRGGRKCCTTIVNVFH